MNTQTTTATASVSGLVPIALAALSDAEANAFVETVFEVPVQHALALTVLQRTGGNPFFIVETTGMVLRARQDGAASSGRQLPPTVQAVVAAYESGLLQPGRAGQPLDGV